MIHSSLSRKIRALRKRSKYTQEDVSQYLNIQRQTYCNYENDARTPPLEIIVALSELYNVSVDYLVRDTDIADEISVPADFEPPTRSQAAKNIHERKLLSEFSSLSCNKQKEVIEFIQFKKQLPD